MALVMTVELMLSKRPVLRITVALFYFRPILLHSHITAFQSRLFYKKLA